MPGGLSFKSNNVVHHKMQLLLVLSHQFGPAQHTQACLF